MKNFIPVRIPLIDYLNNVLAIIQENNPKTLNNKNHVATLLFQSLIDKEVIPISNRNGHNYPIGEPIRITKDLTGSIRKSAFSVSNVPARVIDFSFLSLIPGGNNIISQDLEISYYMDIAEYIKGLEFLKKVIEAEIEYCQKSTSDTTLELLESIRSMIFSPVKIESVLTFSRAINKVSKEVKTCESKNGRIQYLKNLLIFPTIE